MVSPQNKDPAGRNWLVVTSSLEWSVASKEITQSVAAREASQSMIGTVTTRHDLLYIIQQRYIWPNYKSALASKRICWVNFYQHRVAYHRLNDNC